MKNGEGLNYWQQEKGEGQNDVSDIPLVITTDVKSHQTCEPRDMTHSKGCYLSGWLNGESI